SLRKRNLAILPVAWFSPSAFSLPWYYCGHPPQAETAFIRADKELRNFRSSGLCQHVDTLTTEYKTEDETDAERGKDRLRRVFADVLLAVVLKTADTIERIIPYLFRATEIFIGDCACGRSKIFGRFARVLPATLCFLSRLR